MLFTSQATIYFDFVIHVGLNPFSISFSRSCGLLIGRFHSLVYHSTIARVHPLSVKLAKLAQRNFCSLYSTITSFTPFSNYFSPNILIYIYIYIYIYWERIVDRLKNSKPHTQRRAISVESQPLTTFITEWGRFMYLRMPQGYVASGDAYTRRYVEIIKNIPLDTLVHKYQPCPAQAVNLVKGWTSGKCCCHYYHYYCCCVLLPSTVLLFILQLVIIFFCFVATHYHFLYLSKN